jgi:hypothetical protein
VTAIACLSAYVGSMAWVQHEVKKPKPPMLRATAAVAAMLVLAVVTANALGAVE